MQVGFSLVLALVFAPGLHATFIPRAPACKCIPGDACWPSQGQWNSFNQSVGGRLVATQHLAAACHNPNFNNARCEYVKSQWVQPSFHDESSSSIMSAFYANNSCDAFTDRNSPCLPGNTVAYAVNATGADDFSKAILFAKQKNLRLVIRNTGHDYMGKSTGKGALSIWTHHLKNVDYLNFQSPGYSGQAVKIGAGIQVEEAYRFTGQRGKVIVGGGCESVGVVGGFTQGGGHGALSSTYGLGADQVLEWEVVDSNGKLLKANRQQNSDLYWALSGGGAGTFGAVLSMTVKLYDDFKTMTAVALDFQNEDDDKFYSAVQKYHELLPSYTAKGGSAVCEVSTQFRLTPLTFPGMKADEARKLLRPLIAKLDENGMNYTYKVTESNNFYQHWNNTIRPNPTQLVQNAQYGGWSVSRDVLKNKNGALTQAMREISDAGCVAVGIGVDVSRPVDNAVHEGWRDTSVCFILSTPWPTNANLEEMKARSKKMTDVCVPALKKLSPATGAYLNEADAFQPDWQQAFYGSKYERLLSIKRKYDPENVFYATTAVGSEAYREDGAGRLCKAR